MQKRYKIGKQVEHGKGKGLVNKLWISKRDNHIPEGCHWPLKIF